MEEPPLILQLKTSQFGPRQKVGVAWPTLVRERPETRDFTSARGYYGPKLRLTACCVGFGVPQACIRKYLLRFARKESKRESLRVCRRVLLLLRNRTCDWHPDVAD
jgi:hypothetical protein